MSESFEEHLRALEDGVRELEGGEATLDESLAAYERSVGHLRACHEILDGAERKVKILAGDGSGERSEEDFETPESA